MLNTDAFVFRVGLVMKNPLDTWARYYKTFYVCNLQMFVPGKHFQPRLVIVSKARAYPRVKHLSNAPLLGRLLDLTTKITLSRKWLPGTNSSL
jgi:hypothetical protein